MKSRLSFFVSIFLVALVVSVAFVQVLTSSSSTLNTASLGAQAADFTSGISAHAFTPTDDAFLVGDEGQNTSVLKIRPGFQNVYLKFTVSGISVPVNKTTLYLTQVTDAGKGTITVSKGSHSNWTETTLTESDRPTAGEVVGRITDVFESSRTYAIEVGGITGNGTYTLVLGMEKGGNDAWFASSEDATTSSRPRLEIVAGGTILPLEAEDSSPRGSFIVENISSASGGKYLVQPTSVPNTTTAREDARLSFNLTQSGNYSLWVRAYAPTTSSDAVYLGFDGKLARTYPSVHGTWVWIQVTRTTLRTGTNRISIGPGESGLRMDMFAVVRDASLGADDLDAYFKIESGKDVPTPPPVSERFRTGDEVQTLDDVYVRTTPAGDIVGVQIKGSRGVIVGGPTYVESNDKLISGTHWWQIDYDNGVGGWTVENWLKVAPDIPTALGFEAESADYQSVFTVGTDSIASGGRYLIQPPTIANSTSGIEVARLPITLPSAGDYSLWVRVHAPNASSDAFYAGFNGMTKRIYPSVHGTYVWLKVTRESLVESGNRISIAHGESELRIDLFAVVEDNTITPTDLNAYFSLAASDPIPEPEPTPEPIGKRTTLSLRGDPTFNPNTLSSEQRARLEQILSYANDREGGSWDPHSMASRDDVWWKAHGLHSHVLAVLTAFRVTGDLRLLDHLDELAEESRKRLHDSWRGTKDGTSQTDGFLNWVLTYNSSTADHGKDTRIDYEYQSHAPYAQIAWVLHNNRDLKSPKGYNYGAHADFWRDYMVNHFEKKHRTRYGSLDGRFPIHNWPPMNSSYTQWSGWHYYMGLLTGKSGYTAEALRMANVMHAQWCHVNTPLGTAYAWIRSNQNHSAGRYGNYMSPSSYADFVFAYAVDFHLEGFGPWADPVHLHRLSRTITQLMWDNPNPVTGGLSDDVGGSVPRCGIATVDHYRVTAHNYATRNYGLLSAWDSSGMLATLTEDMHVNQSAKGVDTTRLLAAQMLNTHLRSSAPSTHTQYHPHHSQFQNDSVLATRFKQWITSMYARPQEGVSSVFRLKDHEELR